jgi:uncharacterized protein
MIIKVKVKPNSRHALIEPLIDGSLVVRVKSPPRENKANLELIDLLSDFYSLPKSHIQVTSGAHKKEKTVTLLSSI